MLLGLLGALLLAGAPGQAEARGGHRSHGHSYYKGHGGYAYHGGQRHYYGYKPHGTHFSFWLGPLWYPAFAFRHDYPYHPETAVIVPERTVYVERPASAVPAESWWYYCESAGGYYPDVASCPKGWVKVPPRPEY